MTGITGVLLTYNEAPNIARALAKLSWLPEIVVVDSNSTDATRAIAGAFPNVRVVTRPFTTHAEQWNYGLTETGIASEWVLALDADYILSDALVQEIQSLAAPAGTAAFAASFVYCIDGRPLRGAAYPPVTVLYRRSCGHYEQDGHTQRVRIAGHVGTLSAPILHDDRKSLTHWLGAQAKYMRLEAAKLSRPAAPLGAIDRMRRWILVMPPAMFFYCYFVRGGILDGMPGLYYALQRTAAELLLSLFLVRRRLSDEADAE
jgi:glycosyltransferase involved in cell wall biosynthesis